MQLTRFNHDEQAHRHIQQDFKVSHIWSVMLATINNKPVISQNNIISISDPFLLVLGPENEL